MEKYVIESKKDKNKSGIVKDENGYYYMLLGALNTYNSNGVFYKVKDFKRLAVGDSILASRIKDGILRGEYQHPDFSVFKDEQSLINRIFKLDLDRICAHIKSVEFINTGKSEPGWDGYNIHLVYGWVKPSGPFAEYLQESLDNVDENVSFSIRCLISRSYLGDMEVRDVLDISTWDFVHEQGVKIATQWSAAGIEESRIIMDGNDVSFCLNGSCIPKLQDIKDGSEHSVYIEKLINKLKDEFNNKPGILDL